MTPFSSLPDLANLVPNPDWANLPLFDRSGWKRVRFGDVVKQLKEEVDPRSGEVERYVAGEHMQTENVHIREWGTINDDYLGPAFIRRFRKGQVLYGSRRTYLKKVAVAEWDGVTANTTFVLEAVEGRLLQELLPWLMLSERFTKHSVQESKGSTNPYINFPDIAKFEFGLPPLSQQRRVAEILWSLDKVLTGNSSIEDQLRNVYKATVSQFFFDRTGDTRSKLFDPKWETLTLQDVVSPNASIRYGIVQVGPYRENGIPTIAIKNLSGDFGSDLHRTSPEIEKQYSNSRVKPGDLLLSIKASVGDVGLVPNHFHGNISRDLARIRCNSLNYAKLLLHLFRSDRYQAYITKYVVGSTRKEISIHNLRRFEVPVPPPDVTEKFVEHAEELCRMVSRIDECRKHMRLLKFAVVNQLF